MELGKVRGRSEGRRGLPFIVGATIPLPPPTSPAQGGTTAERGRYYRQDNGTAAPASDTAALRRLVGNRSICATTAVVWWYYHSRNGTTATTTMTSAAKPDTRKRPLESRRKEPDCPAVLRQRGHGRYYHRGAVLPLVTLRPYYRWQCGTTAGSRGTTAGTQTGQGREERSLQWNGKDRRVRS